MDVILAGKEHGTIFYVSASLLTIKQKKTMGNLLYVIAVILVIAWLLGYFAFHVTTGLIHVLLVAAVIVFLIKLIGGNRSL